MNNIFLSLEKVLMLKEKYSAIANDSIFCYAVRDNEKVEFGERDILSKKYANDKTVEILGAPDITYLMKSLPESIIARKVVENSEYIKKLRPDMGDTRIVSNYYYPYIDISDMKFEYRDLWHDDDDKIFSETVYDLNGAEYTNVTDMLFDALVWSLENNLYILKFSLPESYNKEFYLILK
jgi:hypothetical protein